MSRTIVCVDCGYMGTTWPTEYKAPAEDISGENEFATKMVVQMGVTRARHIWSGSGSTGDFTFQNRRLELDDARPVRYSARHQRGVLPLRFRAICSSYILHCCNGPLAFARLQELSRCISALLRLR